VFPSPVHLIKEICHWRSRDCRRETRLAQLILCSVAISITSGTPLQPLCRLSSSDIKKTLYDVYRHRASSQRSDRSDRSAHVAPSHPVLVLFIGFRFRSVEFTVGTPDITSVESDAVANESAFTVQPSAAAVNVTLLAFAADHRAAAVRRAAAAPLLPSARNYRSISPARGALGSTPAGRRCCCRYMG